ncbi:MAG: serine hydrolase [Sphingomonadales bacterium]|nr:serine hydrolase [Sphingomonadales bacterium]
MKFTSLGRALSARAGVSYEELVRSRILAPLGMSDSTFRPTDEQRSRIGNQTGGRVGFFAHTDDFAATQARLVDAGVQFQEQPRHEPYGTVAVFSDPFGNRWDLIEPKVLSQ